MSMIVDIDDDEYVNDSEVSDELYRSVDAFSSEEEDAASEFYQQLENEITPDS